MNKSKLQEIQKSNARKAGMIEIILNSSGSIDGMELARKYNKANRDEMDWHIASYFLDDLRNSGIIESCGNDNGMTKYKLS